MRLSARRGVRQLRPISSFFIRREMFTFDRTFPLSSTSATGKVPSRSRAAEPVASAMKRPIDSGFTSGGSP